MIKKRLVLFTSLFILPYSPYGYYYSNYQNDYWN
nr:MAG TPA: hypothetical protein [Inoviridae sp.]